MCSKFNKFPPTKGTRDSIFVTACPYARTECPCRTKDVQEASRAPEPVQNIYITFTSCFPPSDCAFSTRRLGCTVDSSVDQAEHQIHVLNESGQSGREPPLQLQLAVSLVERYRSVQMAIELSLLRRVLVDSAEPPDTMAADFGG